MAFMEGLDADATFNTTSVGYRYADLTSLPNRCCQSVGEINMQTRFTKTLSLMSPLVTAPLESVTESRMAIAAALAGGIGVIHARCSPERQAKEVSLVKGYEHGFIMDPHVLPPDGTVEDLDKLKQLHNCSTAMITDGGKLGTKLLGIATARDIDFIENRKTSLRDVMTPKAQLAFAREPISLTEALQQLREKRKGKLPILNDVDELVAVVSRSDLRRSMQYPMAARDANRQLLVAAAVIPRTDESERVRLLVEAGVDALVFNASQGDSIQQVDFLKRVKHQYPQIDVVCGNVVTPRQAKALLDAGADALRVGVGCGPPLPGSVGPPPSGREACAVGRPSGSAIYHVARLAREYGVPVIADGGIRCNSDISMALTLGASTVMCGPMLAGSSECPGDAFFANGERLKLYRGAGPFDAGAVPSAHKHKQKQAAPEHARCAVVDRGPAGVLFTSLLEDFALELRRLGASSIEQLHGDMYSSKIRFRARG